MPYLVRDRLFFGNISDAAEALQSGGGEFTHVLSLLSSASISFFSDWRPGLSIPTKELRKVFVREEEASAKKALAPDKILYSMELAGEELKTVRMAVPLRDTEDEDLIDYLDVCLDFVDEGRKVGCVLVHCFAGVSRSAAVITAYLMRTEQRTLEDALESLRQCCEFVCPNDGFLDQLKLFEDMGFKVDTSNPLYKRFRLKVLGHSYKQGEKIDSYIFGVDPGLPQQLDSSEVSIKNDKKKTAYRCKKCRRVIALQANVVSHAPGEGETCFDWQKRRSHSPFNRFDESECSSIFVEPLRWMTAELKGKRMKCARLTSSCARIRELLCACIHPDCVCILRTHFPLLVILSVCMVSPVVAIYGITAVNLDYEMRLMAVNKGRLIWVWITPYSSEDS